MSSYWLTRRSARERAKAFSKRANGWYLGLPLLFGYRTLDEWERRLHNEIHTGTTGTGVPLAGTTYLSPMKRTFLFLICALVILFISGCRAAGCGCPMY